MSQFEKLMGELAELGASQETMTKALPAEDGKDEEKIQAAAAEGGLDGDEDDTGGKPDGDAGDEAEGKKPMAKSFKFTLEDGTEMEAEDGAALVKSLQDKFELSEGNLIKALDATAVLIKGQGELIKSLSDRVSKLSGEGRGRKAVVSVVEKPAPGASPMAKSMQPEGMTHDQFFAKALSAQRDGKISGMDIAMAESCLNRGEAIPPSILQRVVA